MKMRFVILLSIVVAMMAVSSTAQRAAADASIVFTSTADFDAGTKSNPGDGNLGVETTTDNLGIASGSFELGNIKGDSFTTAKSDAVTFKWSKVLTTGTAPDSFSISGGQANLLYPLHVGNAMTDLFSVSTISGNWDVRVKVTAVATGAFAFQMFLNKAYYAAGGQAGVMWYWIGSTNGMHAYAVNGGLTEIGTGVTAPALTTYLRMTRSTNTFTWYYSTDGVSWTLYQTTVSAGIGNSLWASPGGVETTAAATWTIDDFYMTAGSVDPGGFRTTGSWTSPTQVFTREAFSSVVVSYSGASAANYISSVQLIDTVTGLPFFTDNTHVTSGSSHTYSVPGTLNTHPWQVLLAMTGDGSGTPNIQDITVNTVKVFIASQSCTTFETNVIPGFRFIVLALIGASVLIAFIFALMSVHGSVKSASLKGGEVGYIIVSVVVIIIVLTILSVILPTFCASGG